MNAKDYIVTNTVLGYPPMEKPTTSRHSFNSYEAHSSLSENCSPLGQIVMTADNLSKKRGLKLQL